jgi:hypothetical protein
VFTTAPCQLHGSALRALYHSEHELQHLVQAQYRARLQPMLDCSTFKITRSRDRHVRESDYNKSSITYSHDVLLPIGLYETAKLRFNPSAKVCYTITQTIAAVACIVLTNRISPLGHNEHLLQLLLSSIPQKQVSAECLPNGHPLRSPHFF